MGAVPWRVLRYQKDGFECREDLVVREEPLTLYVNDREVVTLLTLGEHTLELALGFLRSEGFFSDPDELLEWQVEPGIVRTRIARDVRLVERLMEKRTVTTGCGKGTMFYGTLDALLCRPVESRVSVSPEDLLRRMGELQKRSGLYRQTGGTHNASLAAPNGTLYFRTDIGRHNAVDMLGGRAFLDQTDLSTVMLLTTGRISSEILIKAGKMGTPILASRSAPTALALRLAEDLQITVIGYIRNGRFNVYTLPDRIEGARQASDPGGGHG